MIKSPQDFIDAKKTHEPLCLLTCYDYSFAKILGKTDLSALLVGDSLGNVVCGEPTTVKVKVEHVVYHTQAVRKALPEHFIISDLPFMSAKINQQICLETAMRLVQEGGCNAVKIEGPMLKNIEAVVKAGIPVMGHLGLEPQNFLTMGKYQMQGKEQPQQEQLKAYAQGLEDVGCFALVLEMIPARLAQEIDTSLTIPTIGIGAGQHTSGQILVLHDMLGFPPKESKKSFVKRYLNLNEDIYHAVNQYCREIRQQKFPPR